MVIIWCFYNIELYKILSLFISLATIITYHDDILKKISIFRDNRITQKR